MSSQSPRRWVTIAGAAVSALFLWVAVRHLDLGSVRETWRTAKPLPWVPLAMLAYMVGHFVRGARLKYLVRREAKLQVTTATNVVVVGYASNNVLPARLGELVRAGMLAERTGMPLAQALTVTFIERSVDGLAILCLLVASTWATHTAGWIAELARVGALVFGLAFAVLMLAVLFPSALGALASRLSQPFGRRAHDTAVAIVTSVVNAAASLRRPLDALTIGVLSIAVWLCESVMFVAVLPALGLPLHLGTALVAMSVTNLGILAPSTPGFVGPFHFFCSQALQAQGLGAETSLAYAVLVHIAFFAPATLWGAGAMLWYGVEVGATAARALAARSSAKIETVAGVPMRVIAQVERREVDVEPTEFDIALAEAFVPASGSSEAVRASARFLAGQIAALPTRVRILYDLGMRLFRIWVRLRHMRAFPALGLEERRSVVESWAFGGITPLRQLFRAPRSTVLLAYYEHPAGLATLSAEERLHLPVAATTQEEVHG